MDATPEPTTGRKPAPPLRSHLEQAVTGIGAPETAEARIRTTWPTVMGTHPTLARLARALCRTVVLAPLGWLLLAPLYFIKLMPIFARRYTLTNRRLMIQRGLRGRPGTQVLLTEIEDIRLVADSYDPHFRSADLEVLSGGKVALTLRGVSEPEAFRQSVVNALIAWVPGKAQLLPLVPASS